MRGLREGGPKQPTRRRPNATSSSLSFESSNCRSSRIETTMRPGKVDGLEMRESRRLIEETLDWDEGTDSRGIPEPASCPCRVDVHLPTDLRVGKNRRRYVWRYISSGYTSGKPSFRQRESGGNLTKPHAPAGECCECEMAQAKTEPKACE